MTVASPAEGQNAARAESAAHALVPESPASIWWVAASEGGLSRDRL